MSHVDPYQYIYTREGREHSIAGNMLSSLFKSHGYCVDPGTKTGIALTPENIEGLKTIAEKYDDQTLLSTVTSMAKGKAPSPRMINDSIMYETTIAEKRRFDNLGSSNQTKIASILTIILHIGLYLAGWRGPEEPYISSPRVIHDTIRAELKISPLIQSLQSNSNYPLIKNFPIMGYFRGNSLKPSVIDTSLNIDQCLNRISIGMNKEYSQLATHLISTAYYYATTVCNSPIPMIEPLIYSIAITP
ncbi:Hypothetical protein HVR_LOCUS43 [uncultured virus]|nr:Hypothetical protein HVR_LOCUS43 [uncultured virus]